MKMSDSSGHSLSFSPQSGSRPLSLRLNFTWTFVGNVLYAATQWGILVVLTRLGTPEDVGRFTLALAITAPVILFSNLQLRAVQATDQNNDFLFGHYWGLRSLSSCFALLIIALFSWINKYPVLTTHVILIISIAKVVESFSDLCYGLFQQHERLDKVARSMILRGVLALIFVLLLMGLTHNVVLGLLGLLLSWVIVLLFHDFMVVKTFVSNALKPIFLKETTFRLLRLSLPLGFVTLLITLTSSIPRYVLERYTDEATLGYFGALAYLIVIGNTVVMALGQASISRLAQFYSVHTDKYLKLLGKLLFLVIVLGFGGISFCLVWGKQILNLLYGIGYGNYADVLVLVAIGGVIGYVGSVFGFGITASRKFQKFTIPYLLVVIVIMISSYLLIPDYGIYGAAWTQIIGSIAMVLAPLSILVWLLKTKEGVSRYKLE